MFEELLERFKENFMNMVTSRLLVLMLVVAGMGGYLIYWIFQLQIVNGEQYYNDFQLKIKKGEDSSGHQRQHSGQGRQSSGLQ